MGPAGGRPLNVAVFLSHCPCSADSQPVLHTHSANTNHATMIKYNIRIFIFNIRMLSKFDIYNTNSVSQYFKRKEMAKIDNIFCDGLSKGAGVYVAGLEARSSVKNMGRREQD